MQRMQRNAKKCKEVQRIAELQRNAKNGILNCKECKEIIMPFSDAIRWRSAINIAYKANAKNVVEVIWGLKIVSLDLFTCSKVKQTHPNQFQALG